MPIMFCDLVGKELQVWSSKLNPEEADKAVKYDSLKICEFDFIFHSDTNSNGNDEGV